MANTIKFKRGSGSDPGTSDLSVGEIAIRTDTAKLFTKNDAGSVVSVSGGVEDGDKGDITVSSSGSVFTIDNGVISTAKIADDAVNSDKLASGLLLSAGTNKNIRFAGNIGEIGSVTGFQAVNDAENANTDFGIRATTIRLATGSAERLRVKDAGIDVTGNISVTGTVDGRDIATDGSKLDGIASGATNVTNTNQLTNGAGFITATLTNEQVQDIVGGMVSGNTESGITVTYQDSDGTLDFSVASQTDNNFTNADHSKLDGIEAGATADQTASEILTLIKTVDGAGSGLDADTLDGVSSASFLRSDADDSASGTLSFNGRVNIGDSLSRPGALDSDADAHCKIGGSDVHLYFASLGVAGGYKFAVQAARDTDFTSFTLNLQSNGGDLERGGNKVWDAGNDGSGSGLDADLLDGQQGSYYRNAGNLNAGTIPDARFPSTLPAVDGSNLTGISAGATGGGSDQVFYENDQTVTTNYTITNGKNAMSAGPITINSGVTVTVGSGETLTIV